MLRKRLFRLAVAASLVFQATPGVSRAAGAEPPSIEPRAAEILKAALTHLAGVANLTLHAEVTSETTLPSGVTLQYPGVLDISLRRPDRLWYKLDAEQRRVAAWYDGKSFTLLDSEKNVCANTPAPEGLGPLFDTMAANLGFRPPLSVLLRDDSPSRIMQRITSGFYVGRGVVAGTACHHLAFRQQNVDLQIWVAEEGAPLIKRLVITRREPPAAPQLVYTIVSWDLKPVLSDEVFTFKPPQGVVQCEFKSLVK
jgi:hypothetical protein